MKEEQSTRVFLYFFVPFALVLSVSFGAALYNQNQEQTAGSTSAQSILVLKMHGEIDGTMWARFKKVVLNSTLAPPDYVIIQMNSTGGDYYTVESMGAWMNFMKNNGAKVYFIAGGFGDRDVCTSGCWLLSTFSQSYFVNANTKWGFDHNVTDFRDRRELLAKIEALVKVNTGTDAFTFFVTMGRTTIFDKPYKIYPEGLIESLRHDNPGVFFRVQTFTVNGTLPAKA